MELGPIDSIRLSGEERFIGADGQLDFTVLDFWRWSVSNLVSNATRGVLAEFLVGHAVGCNLGVRDEWAEYDLLTSSGLRLEVKSAAFIQSWAQKRPSNVSFSYKKRQGVAQPTGTPTSVRRSADVYVFALLVHLEQATLNPLDLSQWEFYIVPTAFLDARTRSQHSITLPSLKTAFAAVAYADLAEAVELAGAEHRRMKSGARALPEC